MVPFDGRKDADKKPPPPEPLCNPLTPRETFRQYLARMVKPREYGDYHMLQALCGAYDVSVAVYKKTEVNAINAGEYVWMVAGDEGEDVPRLAMFLEGEHYENLVTFEEVWRM